MVSGSLALLYIYLCMRVAWFSLGHQGSGPDRGQIPIEWGDLWFIRPFNQMLVRPLPPQRHLARPEAQLTRPEAQPASQPASQPVSGVAGWDSGLAGWVSGLAG